MNYILCTLSATAKLAPWDISYLIEQDSKRSLSFNQEELRPYLRFDKVLQALFDLSSTLFGIKIEVCTLFRC